MAKRIESIDSQVPDWDALCNRAARDRVRRRLGDGSARVGSRAAQGAARDDGRQRALADRDAAMHEAAVRRGRRIRR